MRNIAIETITFNTLPLGTTYPENDFESELETAYEATQGLDALLSGQSLSDFSLPFLSQAPKSIDDILEVGKSVIALGYTPVWGFDIDGTTSNARARASRTMIEWASQEYTGPARPAMLTHTSPWHIFARGGTLVSGLTFRQQIEFMSWFSWDTVALLKQFFDFDELVKQDPKIVEHAIAHFIRRFHDLENWHITDALPGTVRLHKRGHAIGFKNVFASFRGIESDTRENGASRTEHMLRRFGSWKEGDELVLKQGSSDYIPADNARTKKRKGPSKIELLLFHLLTQTRIPNPLLIAFFDNDTIELNAADALLGSHLASVYTRGDLPPGAPLPRQHYLRLNPF